MNKLNVAKTEASKDEIVEWFSQQNYLNYTITGVDVALFGDDTDYNLVIDDDLVAVACKLRFSAKTGHVKSYVELMSDVIRQWSVNVEDSTRYFHPLYENDLDMTTHVFDSIRKKMETKYYFTKTRTTV